MTRSLQITPLATEQWLPASFRLRGPDGFRLVTGLHKLLQQVNFYLATSPGSLTGWPSFGNTILDRLRQTGGSETREDLLSELTAGIEREFSMFQTNVPDDERLRSVEISLQGIEQNGMILLVEVESQAGQQARYDYSLITGIEN